MKMPPQPLALLVAGFATVVMPIGATRIRSYRLNDPMQLTRSSASLIGPHSFLMR